MRPLVNLGGAMLALSLSAAPMAAQAATTVGYPDFSNTIGLTFVGDAATATTSDGTVLRLTPAAGYQTGAAYGATPITLGAGDTFSSTFQFRFTGAGGIDPADGVTLVLAADASQIGATGGGLGYQGVPNSLAIEYDTFDNGGLDPNDNHVAVDEDGVLTNDFAATPYGVAPCDFSAKAGCMSNGDLWTTTIAYDGTNLKVTVQDGAMAIETLIDAPVDVAALLGTDVAYVGLTGSTGSGYENHDIKDFSYSNTLGLVSGAPEPSAWALMLTGVATMGGMLRLGRRRQALAVA